MIRLPKFEYRGARSVDEALGWLGDLSGAGDGEKDSEQALAKKPAKRPQEVTAR